MKYQYDVDLNVLEQLAEDLEGFGLKQALNNAVVFAMNLCLEEVRMKTK